MRNAPATLVRDRPAPPLAPELGERLRAMARRLGTPLYAYDAPTLEADARRVALAFPDPWVRLYSVKANPLPGLVARLGGLGFGASAVSRGEGWLALRAGLPTARVALEGVGKAPADLRWAVELARAGRPLLWVSLESAEEAQELLRLARRRLGDERLEVLLRLNPDVEPDTERGLAVGRGDSKFGLFPEEADSVLAELARRGPLRFRGVHVHAGSQLRSVEPWAAAVRVALDLFARHAGRLEGWDTLDVGGGFPADPWEDLPGPEDFARAARAALEELPPDRRPARLAVEPGRFLVARSGWVVASVLHVRAREAGPGLRQVVLDAGMTEIIRPMLYGARHPVVALTSNGRPAHPDLPVEECVVEGPVCESTDRLGTAPLPPVRRGDLVAVGHAGAYSSAMSSTYNGRPRPPEVLLEPDGTLRVLRRRAPLRSLA
ncbi:MAG TPA: diaminopimelate decarboxylase [Actinomycetota bacterium]|nr:diaminopimelate decarboxylase [Actinomycetota bacterium]